MIIAGGHLLQSKIKKTKIFLYPLDSEHFSLLNSNINNKKYKKNLYYSFWWTILF